MQVRVAIKPDCWIREETAQEHLHRCKWKGQKGLQREKDEMGILPQAKGLPGSSRTSCLRDFSLSAACTQHPDDLQRFCSKPICWTQEGGGEDREEKKKQNLLLFTSVIVRPAWKQRAWIFVWWSAKLVWWASKKWVPGDGLYLRCLPIHPLAWYMWSIQNI